MQKRKKIRSVSLVFYFLGVIFFVIAFIMITRVSSESGLTITKSHLVSAVYAILFGIAAGTSFIIGIINSLHDPTIYIAGEE